MITACVACNCLDGLTRCHARKATRSSCPLRVHHILFLVALASVSAENARAISFCEVDVFPCADVPLVDDFNRADGPLGEEDPTSVGWVNAWDIPLDTRVFILDNAATGDVTDDLAGAAGWAESLPADAEVSITIVSINGNFEDSNIVMRAQEINDQPSGQAYYCIFDTETPGGDPGQLGNSDLDTFGLERREGWQPRFQSTTLIPSTVLNHEFAPGDVVGMRTMGNTITCFVKEVGGVVHSISYVDDSSSAISSGGWAQLFIKADRFSQTGDDERWDDFHAGGITTAQVVPLSRGWAMGLFASFALLSGWWFLAHDSWHRRGST